MTNEEFSYQILKRNHPRKVNITNSYGLTDAYIFYKNHFKDLNKSYVSNKIFSTIIKEVNLEICERLAQGEIINLPFSCGKLILDCHSVKSRIENNKLIKPQTIDWKETLKLWNSDKEAFDNKLLIRRTVPYIYRVVMLKTKVHYKNIEYTKFKTGRKLKLYLKKLAEEDKLIGRILK